MWNTLNSYGESVPAFIEEGQNPVETESSYKRHTVGERGGEVDGNKETKKSTGVISECQN